MARIRFYLEGDVCIAFLSDVDRLIDIIDDHMRESLAHIRSLHIFYNHRHAGGIAEYICDTEEDHYAVFEPIRFEFLGVMCTLTFENGFIEE